MMGAAPQVHLPHIVNPTAPADPGKVMETERQMFSLRDGDNQNPYSWDFDLCSLTLGNFNYRKMTLVRDYAKLIETDMASGAFDTVFSLSPKPSEDAPPPMAPIFHTATYRSRGRGSRAAERPGLAASAGEPG